MTQHPPPPCRTPLVVALTVCASTVLAAPEFVRGRVTADGDVNISDAIAILEALFSRGTIPCEDAADANDDGRVDLSDALKVLLHLFGPSGDLPSPSRACGLDPTADDLSCFEASECR